MQTRLKWSCGCHIWIAPSKSFRSAFCFWPLNGESRRWHFKIQLVIQCLMSSFYIGNCVASQSGNGQVRWNAANNGTNKIWKDPQQTMEWFPGFCTAETTSLPPKMTIATRVTAVMTQSAAIAAQKKLLAVISPLSKFFLTLCHNASFQFRIPNLPI